MPSGPLEGVLRAVENASREAGRPSARLVAVGKTRDASELAALAADWTRLRPGTVTAFGENYVQEAATKAAALAGAGIEWHLIGHLQSNKAAHAATLFDWVQSVDRVKLVDALAAARPADRKPLAVLVQVNIDDEASKHGCAPADVMALADAIAARPTLALRGLMAIPAPRPDRAGRGVAFAAMRALFDTLSQRHPGIDTLSMGMSADFAEAIAGGATMVRVGSALFGARA